MTTIGVTFVRQHRVLHYPIHLVMESMEELDGRLIVCDLGDPDLPGLKALAAKYDAILIPSDAWRGPGDGNTRMRGLLRSGLQAAVRDGGARRVLYLEADEYMEPRHIHEMLVENPVVAWLPRWQLWNDNWTIRRTPHLRLDWSLSLPRFCDRMALTEGFDRRCGDASVLPVISSHDVAQFPHWPIWHLSRLGSTRMIAKRRRAVASFYVPEAILDVPERYDFVTRRYENWEKGKMPPPCEWMVVSAPPVPPPVIEWAIEDGRLGEA